MGGQACSAKLAPCTVRTGENTLVTGTPDYTMRPPGITRSRSEVHMLICALDYKKTKNPLTCTRDGKNMEAMAKQCGIRDLQVMYDEQCTKSAVKIAIRNLGKRCRENDFFVFYYSGHGTEVKDESGDEKDGLDEAFCFVTPTGQVDRSSLLTDDEFVETLLSAVAEDVNILVLADCCHSGTIVDLRKSTWAERSAIAVVGCTDQQTSADIGVGGIFTHSMLMAMEKLSQDEHYSVGKLYNTAVKENDRIFKGAQSITMDCSSLTAPNQKPWPFVPQGPYQSPLRKAKNAGQFRLGNPGGGGNPAGAKNRDIDIGDYKDVPDDLAKWAQENDIDLGSDYEDEELENGWKPHKELLNKLGF